MLSPGKVQHKLEKNDSQRTAEWEQRRPDRSLPLSSSAAKKAARQSSRVTMGPQNQVGMHETTNLFVQREPVIKKHRLRHWFEACCCWSCEHYMGKGELNWRPVWVEFNSNSIASAFLWLCLLKLHVWATGSPDGCFKSLESFWGNGVTEMDDSFLRILSAHANFIHKIQERLWKSLMNYDENWVPNLPEDLFPNIWDD